jgi:hypothetical protein
VEGNVYRCEATSIEGFVQQLAVSYIANGYWFYVTGSIPQAKEPRTVDAKLIAQFGVDVSRWTRCRRKRAGLANVQYLRHDRFFVVLATHGDHPFFAAEAPRLRDVREHPVHFAGYAIGCRRGRDGRRYHASVRISRKRHRALKARFAAIAVQRSADELGRELRGLPFSPYAPVRAQLRELLRAVNRHRKAAGLELVPRDVLRWHRRPVRPFDDLGAADLDCST